MVDVVCQPESKSLTLRYLEESPRILSSQQRGWPEPTGPQCQWFCCVVVRPIACAACEHPAMLARSVAMPLDLHARRISVRESAHAGLLYDGRGRIDTACMHVRELISTTCMFLLLALMHIFTSRAGQTQWIFRSRISANRLYKCRCTLYNAVLYFERLSLTLPHRAAHGCPLSPG